MDSSSELTPSQEAMLLALSRGKPVRITNHVDERALIKLVKRGWAEVVISFDGMQEARELTPHHVQQNRSQDMTVEDTQELEAIQS